MTTIFHPGQRVIARTNQQGLSKGKPYSVRAVIPQPIAQTGDFVVAYRVSNWPNRNPVEHVVKAGICHLRPV